jgi:hypothetical protein
MCPEPFTTAGCLLGLTFVDLTESFIEGRAFGNFFNGNFTSDEGLGRSGSTGLCVSLSKLKAENSCTVSGRKDTVDRTGVAYDVSNGIRAPQFSATTTLTPAKPAPA